MQDDRIEGFALSPQQKHLWLLQQHDRGLPYRTQGIVVIEGDLDAAILQAAIDDTIDRHEILRTVFRCLPGMTIPLQVIIDRAPRPIPAFDFSMLAPEEQARRVDGLYQDLFRSVIDIEHGPSLQGFLVRLAAQTHLLLLCLPALCADAATLNHVVGEIRRAYGARLGGPPLDDEPLQYADLAQWQNEQLESDEAEAGHAYWREQELVSLIALNLPIERQYAAQPAFAPRWLSSTLDERVTAQLAALADQQALSVATLLLVCWQILLWRLCGQADIVVGVASDGRSYEGLEDALGLFAKYVPIRAYITETTRFGALVQQVTGSLQEAHEWQECFTWEQIGARPGSAADAPFFPVCFDFAAIPAPLVAGDVTFSIRTRQTYIDRFKLNFACVCQDNKLITTIHYDSAVFDSLEIERLLAWLQKVAAGALADPQAAIIALDILSAAERGQLLTEFNDTQARYPAHSVVHGLFADQAARTPDQTAVVDGDRKLSFAELNARSNQLAHYLRSLGVGPERLVAICVERSAEMLVGMLGVLKAGGAYAPLDLSYPPERLSFMLADTQAVVVLTATKEQRPPTKDEDPSSFVRRLPFGGATLVDLIADWPVIAQRPTHNPASGVRPENLAYVLYTSGSTGTPKGVMIPHRGMVNYLTWCTQAYAIREGGGAPVHSSIGFDLTITSLFGPLLSGRSVLLLPEHGGIEALVMALRGGQNFSLVKLTPAHLALLRQLLPAEEAVGRTRALIIGGEALFGEQLIFWRYHAPGARLINEYGPTETVVGCCVYEFPPDIPLTGAAPIGRPIANMQIYLLDRYAQPTPLGIPGELYIGGAGVARGYLNRPDLTAERFVPNPFVLESEVWGMGAGVLGPGSDPDPRSLIPDPRLYRTGDLARYRRDGLIEFLGRLDDQVKIRGYRIELGEIATVIEQHPAIHEAVVVAREYAPGERRLVAYLVPDQQRAYTVRQLLRLERDHRLSDRQTYELPNGLVVFQHNKNETDYLYREIFEEQEYLRHGISLNDGDCVFDVGANIGLFTLFAGTRYKNLDIYAFEPIPPIFDVLRFNADIYSLNAKVFNIGMSNRSTSATFTYYPHLSLMSGRFADTIDDREIVKSFERNQRRGAELAPAEWDGQLLDELLEERLSSQQFTCQLSTISDVIRDQRVERIDLLKIDVEKSELDVLAGIQGGDWAKIRQIVLELHDIDGRLEQVIALLDHQGYQVVVQQAESLANTNLYDIYARRPGADRMPARPQGGEPGDEALHTWSSASRLIDDVGQFLSTKLPEYMLPAAWVVLDGMPLTHNGKVDRQALPAPNQTRPEAERAFVAPRTPAEQALADIWKQLLRIEHVGIHDNFFGLGGDSILSIQVIARAQRAGLRLTPMQFFQYQTIAELAAVADVASPIQAEQQIVLGPLPLTPIQHWFFEHNQRTPQHGTQSLLLEARRSLSLSAMARVAQQVLAHHDALHLRFVRNESSWQQRNAEPDLPLPFATAELSALPEPSQDVAIEAIVGAVQNSLDLADGPMVRIVFFKFGSRRPDMLLITCHRLVIDAISWRILLEDLQLAYTQLERGERIQLPLKTTSFKRWVERLDAHARSKPLRDESAYWLAALGKPLARLPMDGVDEEAADHKIMAHTLPLLFDIEETRALLYDVPRAYRTQINDVLLTALARTLASWTNQSSLLISLERHGRELLFDDIDLSRTIGWFSSVFPVVLELDAASGPGEALKAIKEQLRRIPSQGMSYGLLRYLGPDSDIGAQLRTLPQAQVNFNYLGQFDQVVSETDLFGPATAAGDVVRSRGIPWTYALEITGSIAAGRLRLNWSYDESLYRRTTIEWLSSEFADALRSLIAHCQSSDAGGYTPSDFPKAKASQHDIDLVVAQISQVPADNAHHDPIEDLYELSPVQEGMLFHTLYNTQSDVYFQQLSCTIHARIDVVAFERAWRHVTQRHAVLRASFHWEGLDKPLQAIHRQIRLPLELLDWSEQQADEQRLDAYLATDRLRGFQLSETPAFRVILIRTAQDRYYLIWSHHHIVLDGWSVALILKEVFALYDAFRSGRQVELDRSYPFGAYIEWLQQQNASDAEAFWRTTLKGFTSPTSLAVGHSGAPDLMQDIGFAEQRISLSAPTTAVLQSLARQWQVTLNTLVQGAWALLLSRYSGEPDVVFGVTVSGRPPTLAGIESMVGLLINTLPLRVQVAGQETLPVWVRRLHAQQATLQQYAYTPLVRIHGWSEVPRGTPLFESLVIYENYPMDDSLQNHSASLAIDRVRFFERTNYPLTLVASARASVLSLRIAYATPRFDSNTITRMLQHLRTLLAGLRKDSEYYPMQAPMLTEAERRQLLVEWNATQATYPQEQEALLHQLFEAQVARTPAAVAVSFGVAQLTYAELNDRANRLAHTLRMRGVRAETRVGICLDRSLELVIGVLGILKAGGAYVPLDPAHPRARTALIMADAQAPLLVTRQRLLPALPDHGMHLVRLDADWDEIERSPSVTSSHNLHPNTLAYVIYTSGSTGAPKGVQIPHRAVVNFLCAMRQQLGMTDRDWLVAITTLSFDIAALELFLPLTVGGRVMIAGHELLIDGEQLSQALVDTGATFMQATPATWRLLIESGWQGSLRLSLLCGGEALPRPLADQLLDRGARLWNLYGPTETTIWSTAAALTTTIAGVTIGRPIANTQIYVVDQQLQPVPLGVPGALYIGGAGLARGYLGRPDLTAERFIPNPFAAVSSMPSDVGLLPTDTRLYRTGDLARYRPDCTLEYLGRDDQQVKIRGFRIELGEIEARLSQHPDVREAAVIVREIQPGDKRLAAYVVPTQTMSDERGTTNNERRKNDEGFDSPFVLGFSSLINELRSFLATHLPDYMIPAVFTLLEGLPRTPNGKIDRRALPDPDGVGSSGEAYVAPRTSLERDIAALWQQALGVEKVGRDDNFFDLGGHSLLMIQLRSKLRALLDRDISIVDLFTYPTVSAFAQYLQQEQEPWSLFDMTSEQVETRSAAARQRRQLRQTGRAPEEQRGDQNA